MGGLFLYPFAKGLRWSGKIGHKTGVSSIVNDVQDMQKIQLGLQGDSGH